MIYNLTPANSINDTLKMCNKNDKIMLSKGIYNEKVIINVEGISIIGENKNEVIIRNKDFFHKIMSDYNECNTFRTFTVAITADNVKIENLTIENSSIPSNKYGQAVALHADGNNLEFNNIILKSAQDTLFTGPLPKDLIERHKGFLKENFLKGNPSKQIYNNCDIYGDVDFIFGSATALFNECNIISIDKNKDNNTGYISAPSHDKLTKFGFLFYKCNLINQTNTKDSIFLARPWRDYGLVAFIDCVIGDHINSKGFANWHSTKRYLTARFYEYSKNVNLEKRVNWAKIFNEDEAIKYYNDFIEYIKK